MGFSETFDQVKKWCLGVDTMEAAEQGIRRDGMIQKGLKTWSSRLGKTALALAGLVILFRSGFMLIPAAAVGVAYGAVKLASYLITRDIDNKLKAAHDMAAEEAAAAPAAKPSRQPQPKATAKVTGTFNAKVSAEPANDAAPPAEKPKTGFLKRFGLGS